MAGTSGTSGQICCPTPYVWVDANGYFYNKDTASYTQVTNPNFQQNGESVLSKCNRITGTLAAPTDLNPVPCLCCPEGYTYSTALGTCEGTTLKDLTGTIPCIPCVCVDPPAFECGDCSTDGIPNKFSFNFNINNSTTQTIIPQPIPPTEKYYINFGTLTNALWSISTSFFNHEEQSTASLFTVPFSNILLNPGGDSPSGQPKSNILAGVWNFHIFANAEIADSASFYIKLYKKNGSTLTLLSTTNTSSLVGTSITEYILTANVPFTEILTNDILHIGVYGNNISNAGLFTIYSEGTDHYSYFTTTIVTDIPSTIYYINKPLTTPSVGFIYELDTFQNSGGGQYDLKTLAGSAQNIYLNGAIIPNVITTQTIVPSGTWIWNAFFTIPSGSPINVNIYYKLYIYNPLSSSVTTLIATSEVQTINLSSTSAQEVTLVCNVPQFTLNIGDRFVIEFYASNPINSTIHFNFYYMGDEYYSSLQTMYTPNNNIVIPVLCNVLDFIEPKGCVNKFLPNNYKDPTINFTLKNNNYI